MALFVYQLTGAVDTMEGLYLLTCPREEVLICVQNVGSTLKGTGSRDRYQKV